jgi:hypothetical protein
MNAGFQRKIHLPRCLADAGEDDLRRRDARRQRPAQFAFGHNIRACAEPGQRLDDGLIGIGLHRIADQRVEAGKAFGKDPIVALERCGRIAVEWRADFGRDVRDRHIFGVQRAVPVFEMVHESGLLFDEAVEDEGPVFFRLGGWGFFARCGRHGVRRVERRLAAAGGERDEERDGEDEGEAAGHDGSGN